MELAIQRKERKAKGTKTSWTQLKISHDVQKLLYFRLKVKLVSRKIVHA
jgi:hypothetical protein